MPAYFGLFSEKDKKNLGKKDYFWKIGIAFEK